MQLFRWYLKIFRSLLTVLFLDTVRELRLHRPWRTVMLAEFEAARRSHEVRSPHRTSFRLLGRFLGLAALFDVFRAPSNTAGSRNLHGIDLVRAVLRRFAVHFPAEAGRLLCARQAGKSPDSMANHLFIPDRLSPVSW